MSERKLLAQIERGRHALTNCTAALDAANAEKEDWRISANIANADAEALAEAMAGLDEMIRYMSERFPAGFEAMPRRLFDALGIARAALAAHDERVKGE